MTLDRLNALDAATAVGELLRCCGSRSWAQKMTAARPFPTVDALTATADVIWSGLGRSDWLEAFAAHPKIGERGSDWSTKEQAGVASAAGDVRQRLAAKNRDYEARFGYIFIVCATGKSADEMLRTLEARLTNDPETEIRVAAEEQAKITRFRLAKLLDAVAVS